MLMDGLVGGLCGGDGLFLQTFADLFGLLRCGFQFGSKFVLLVVSTFCCFHSLFPFLVQPRTAVGPSQQQPLPSRPQKGRDLLTNYVKLRRMFGRLLLNGLVVFLTATQAVASAPMDVYILTGQSNSLGTTTLEGSSYFPTTLPEDAKIPFFWANAYGFGGYPLQLYGMSGNKILTLRMQQGDGSNPSFWGPEYGFGRTLYEAGRTNFLIIKASNGGGGNTLWDKATFDTNHAAGPMWGHVSNTVNTALGVLAASGQ